MKPEFKIVELLPGSGIIDIVQGLRNLADEIEASGIAPHNIAYAADYGDSDIRPGLLGQSAAAGAETHILFAVAMRRLEML